MAEAKGAELKPADEPAPAKRPKTGGRVKKSLDDLLAKARVANEIAGMHDDTTLPEELAAIYLGISVSELAEHRKAKRPAKTGFGSKSSSSAETPPRLKMIKPIREDAVGQNQKVLYKLGDLRDYQKAIKVESSFDAAVTAGLYGFVSIQAPFFATIPKKADRGRSTLIAKAWDKLDPKWGERFKDVADGKLQAVWLTPAQAASSRWTTVAAHKAFAKPWLAALKVEGQAVKAAIEGTEIAEVVVEPPLRKGANGLRPAQPELTSHSRHD